MGRLPKRGLLYFNKDVDFYQDHKIVRLAIKYGPIGLTTYDVLLTMIYREGYYIKLSASEAALNVVRTVGDRWYTKNGISAIDFAAEIILYCAEIGLFDESLVRQEVITSVGIQRRYAAITARNKVKTTDYWLLGEDGNRAACESMPKNRISDAEMPISVTEMPISDAEMQQSKEKKSKVNQSRSPEGVSVAETPSDTPLRGQDGQTAREENRLDMDKVMYVIAEYNRILPMLPHANISAALIRAVAPSEKSREAYTELFNIASRSSFLTSKKSNWRCDIIWLTKPENMDKVLAGKYDDYGKAPHTHQPEKINGIDSGFDTASFFQAALDRGREDN